MTKRAFLLSTASLIVSALLVSQNIAMAQSDTNGPPANIPDMGNIPGQGQFGPGSGIPSGATGAPANIPNGPSEDQLKAMQQGQERQMRGMKQAVTGMENALKRFEAQFAALEKKGITVSDATKQKLNKIRTTIDAMKNAKTPEEIQNIDQEEIQATMQELGESIGGYQKMGGLKKMLAGMKRGLASFEQRLGQMEKQKVTVPEEIKTDVAKLKEGLKAIEDAKDPEELRTADPEALGDLMTKINESRPQLEMLAKWPRILNQADKQIAQFQKQLASTKTLVGKLKAGGFDATEDYTAFEQDVKNLKAARDEADALVKDGKGEEAFTKMEDEFFNKLDDVGEHQRVIQQLSNLGRFSTEFKRGMASAKKQIDALKRRKINTAELQTIYDQALAKGNAIVALIKAKPLDEEAIMAAMDEMESLKQDFQNKADELSGGQPMPWEDKTPSQFQALTMPKDFGASIPK